MPFFPLLLTPGAVRMIPRERPASGVQRDRGALLRGEQIERRKPHLRAEQQAILNPAALPSMVAPPRSGRLAGAQPVHVPRSHEPLPPAPGLYRQARSALSSLVPCQSSPSSRQVSTESVLIYHPVHDLLAPPGAWNLVRKREDLPASGKCFMLSIRKLISSR